MSVKSLKKYISIIVFLLILVLSYSVMDRLFCIKSSHGIVQARAMYYQPRNTIDVVMLGSSHIHCDINTALLWKNHGIAAYDYSAAEQPLWETYHYLIEVCKYQNPKVVVLDLFSPARFKDDYQYYWLNDNLSGMRFSLNKLEMLSVSSKPDMYENYFPSFSTYHTRYKDLTMEDFREVFEMSRLENFKGYTPYLHVDKQEEPKLDEESTGGITLKSEMYLSKIIDYTKENNIDLFLIVTPYITNDDDEMVYNRIKEIAGEKNIEFNSTNYDYEKMGINFEEDFSDFSHLNYQGSCKFTEYLAGELLERFDIPDHRGDEKYISWEISAQIIEDYVNGKTDSFY